MPALNTGRPEQLVPALERRDVDQATATTAQSGMPRAFGSPAACIWHVPAGRSRTSRSAGSDDDLVARTFVPAALSECVARRVPDVGAIRSGSNSRRCDGPSRSRALVDTTGEPGTSLPRLALPARRSPLLASGLTSSPTIWRRPIRSSALRALGARHISRRGSRSQQAAGASQQRTYLQRRCEEVLGKSPLAYFQDCVLNARKRSCAAAASISTPSLPKSATSMAQR